MNIHMLAGCALAIATTTSAQVSIQLATTAPMVVTCTEGSTTSSATQPVATGVPIVQLTASTPNTNVYAMVLPWSDPLGCRIAVNLSATVGAGAPTGSSAAVGPGSVLAYLTCPTATPIRWQTTFVSNTDPGLPQPGIEVDIADDGVVDYINGQRVSPMTLDVVGPTPLPVRVTMTGMTQQAGFVGASLLLDMLPDTQVDVTTVAIGCTAGQASTTARPTFLSTGVRLSAYNHVPQVPWVAMVIGWNTQPLLLPSFGSLPCLLVPTPDVVLLQGQLLPGVDVPLPPAVRPLTFWVQGVALGAQLMPTDCLRVNAL